MIHALVPPMSGKAMCPALSALTSRQLIPVNLVSAVGATAVEVSDHIVKPAIGAPGKLLKDPKRLNPTIKRDSPDVEKTLSMSVYDVSSVTKERCTWTPKSSR